MPRPFYTRQRTATKSLVSNLNQKCCGNGNFDAVNLAELANRLARSPFTIPRRHVRKYRRSSTRSTADLRFVRTNQCEGSRRMSRKHKITPHRFGHGRNDHVGIVGGCSEDPRHPPIGIDGTVTNHLRKSRRGNISSNSGPATQLDNDVALPRRRYRSRSMSSGRTIESLTSSTQPSRLIRRAVSRGAVANRTCLASNSDAGDAQIQYVTTITQTRTRSKRFRLLRFSDVASPSTRRWFGPRSCLPIFQ